MTGSERPRLVLTDADVANMASQIRIDIRPEELHEVAVRLASTVEQLAQVMEMDLSNVVPIVVLPELT